MGDRCSAKVVKGNKCNFRPDYDKDITTTHGDEFDEDFYDEPTNCRLRQESEPS